MNPRFLPLVIVTAIIAVALIAGTATAHAQYVSSTPGPNAILPSPPTKVSITLSEAIQAGSGNITVRNTTGSQFAVPPLTLSSDGRTMSVGLKPGGPCVYTVAWTAVSAVDGHVTAGAFSYAVQNPDGTLCNAPFVQPNSSGPPVSAAEVALRFVSFFGLSVALGVVVLVAFMWLPAGRDPDVRSLPGYGLGLQVLLNTGRMSAFAFGTSMVGLWALATGLEGAAGLLASTYLWSIAIRLVLAVGLFFFLSREFARARRGIPDAPAKTLLASLAFGAAALVAGSIGTHAAADPQLAVIGVAANAAHLAGIALWVGGLVGIVAVRTFLRETEAAPLARIVLGRFSRMAFYAVGLVLGGGVVLALLLVRTIDALIGTAYGWVVLGKVALFAPMIAFGAYNRYRLIPRTAGSDQPVSAVRRLVGNVRFEAGLGVSILVLAGLLTAMQPSVSLVAAGPVVLDVQQTVDDLRMDFQIIPYPTVPGVYTFEMFVYNATSGREFDFGRNGTLRFTLCDPDLPGCVPVSGFPPQIAKFDGPHGNHFIIASSAALSRAGTWKIDTEFERFDAPLPNVRATFYVSIRGG